MDNSKKNLGQTNKANMTDRVPHRIPPQDIEAEQATLASMLLNNEALGEILELIDRDCFYRQDHAEIFDAIVTLYESNQPVDFIFLKNELNRRNKLEVVGGINYIVDISESLPSAVNGIYYARIIYGKSLLRKAIQVSSEISEMAFAENDQADDILEDIEKKVFEVTHKKETRKAVSLGQTAKEAIAILESRDGNLITGVSSGYLELDNLTCGFQPGEMIIIAARPSMGKTALGLNIAEYVAADSDMPVAFFSLEMTANLLTERLIASRSHVDLQKYRRGRLNEDEFDKVHVVAEEYAHVPLYIDDSGMLTPLDLRAKARRMKMQFDIQLMIIDYLQLMKVPGCDNRVQEVGLISRHIKAIAKELEIPVIAMSQLNRGVEAREGHRPRMSDLRESGDIEQDADVVMLLHREGYYKQKSILEHTEYLPGSADIDETKTEIILEKQRSGPTGVIELTWLKEWTRFESRSNAVEF